MYLIDPHRKPPRQVLRGAGFVLIYNPDTAPAWKCIRLVRRAQVISTAGIVRSRVELVRYEVYVDGEVVRVRQDGEPKTVPQGHAEWRWVQQAMSAIHAGQSGPPDLVRWRTAWGSRKAEWNGARIATMR